MFQESSLKIFIETWLQVKCPLVCGVLAGVQGLDKVTHVLRGTFLHPGTKGGGDAPCLWLGEGRG